MFHSIQYRNDWLAASDLSDMFTQSIKFYTFHYQYRCLKNVIHQIDCQYRCLKNVIHQIDSKNGWLHLSASFTAKFGLVFVLTLFVLTFFLRVFIFKPTQRAQVLLKNGTRDFQNSSTFERSACFYVTISEKFEHFQYFNFETDFLENKNLLNKTRVSFFS